MHRTGQFDVFWSYLWILLVNISLGTFCFIYLIAPIFTRSLQEMLLILTRCLQNIIVDQKVFFIHAIPILWWNKRLQNITGRGRGESTPRSFFWWGAWWGRNRGKLAEYFPKVFVFKI